MAIRWKIVRKFWHVLPDNIASAIVGSCPVNGSISRTSMNEQYSGHSQVVSITAGITMTFLLLFFTGFIRFLPVPILTAIVISALMDVVEIIYVFGSFTRANRNFIYLWLPASVYYAWVLFMAY